MRFYYYCMSNGSKSAMVTLANMCAGRKENYELDKLREEEIKLFEITECTMSREVSDIFILGGRLHALHSDGTIVYYNGTILDKFPAIKCIEHRTIAHSQGDLCRGKDGKLYDDSGKECSEAAVRFPFCTGTIQKEGNQYHLLNCVTPLARLQEMDSNYCNFRMWERSPANYRTDLYRTDLKEIKSENLFFGSDGTCLMSWNGLPYSFTRVRDSILSCAIGSAILMDVAYREDYDFDDIAMLVADNIYVNHKGKLVFMKGWNTKIGNSRPKFNDAVVKAQKWENLVQCEVLDGHLVGKTKDGRILTTFESDICGDLKNIEHAFVGKDFAFFLVK